MGLGDLNTGDDDSTDSDNDASVSYIYLYEDGRDEIENWDSDAQDLAARAYDAASDGGVVRETFNDASSYENIHHGYSDMTAAMADVFESGDFQPILDFIGPNAEALATYLDNHKDVRNDLVQRMKSTEATADD